MKRYIKLDEWEKHFDKMMTGCPLPKKTIAKIKQMWIDGMPTADVVEVVRCKDCRHASECHKSVQYTRNEPNSVTIGYSQIEWCSRGERKEESEVKE